MKTIEQYNFKNKRVLVRVDFNVPINHNFQLMDDTRLKEALPTLKKLLNDGASVIVMSHLGRPSGEIEYDYSMRSVIPQLSNLLTNNIKLAPDCIGEKTQKMAKALKPGEVLVLENLRFYEEEMNNDDNFAKKLASMGNIYVNDAFSVSHRSHASIDAITKYVKEKYMGLLFASELEHISKFINGPEKPVTMVIGGAKIANKLKMFENLASNIDNVIIGGGISYTFIKALGGDIGGSDYEEKNIDMAKSFVKQAMLKGVNLYFPIDAIVANSFSNKAEIKITPIDQIKDGWIGLDIGPESCKRTAEIIKKSKTILWNGPMGVFELPNFNQGTKALAINIASSTIRGAYSLIGGGDTVAAINKYFLADQISFVSTGGNAMLEYLEGKEIPGIKALM